MQRVTTVVVGAGQCGLAMSRELGRRSVDHVVLEKGRVGNSWHAERWDSLRLLTPNWMSAPAGHPYDGPEPDGFMSGIDFAARLHRAAALDEAPVMTDTRVLSLDRLGGRYRLQTDRGAMVCDSVVIATGGMRGPEASALRRGIAPRGRAADAAELQAALRPARSAVLVVGASASGLQIARELNRSGRPVTLAVGNHLRLPRRYRGADILCWMHRIGVMDVPYTEVLELDRLRRAPSLPLSVTPRCPTSTSTACRISGSRSWAARRR